MNRINLMIFLLSSLFLAACGGGGDTSSPLPTAPVSSFGLSTGTITGFGSVFVNGTRFNTDTAEIRRGDDLLNDVRELRKGMVVSVQGDLDRAIASSVRYREDVKGPADVTVNDTGSDFEAMGQRIRVDAATVFDNRVSLPSPAGTVYEVSGHRLDDGSILATFVEQKNPSEVTTYKVRGRATGVDQNARTFRIDQLTVDYSSADTGDLSGANPSEGQLVEVKDDNSSYVAGSRRLAATRIEPAHELGEDARLHDRVEIEGVVTEVTVPGSRFRIGALAVNITPTTQFRYGVAGDLAVGSVIQVKAIVSDDDTLDAVHITFKRNKARVQGPADADGNASTGEVSVLGVVVSIGPDTMTRDKPGGNSGLGAGDIQAGDYLEIQGIPTPDGKLAAARLEREQSRSKAELRSVATTADAVARTVTLLGITVQAGPGTKLEDLAGNIVSADSFFAAVTPGLTVVKAKWDPFSDTALAPTELELEDDFSNERLHGDDHRDDDTGDHGAPDDRGGQR